MFSKSKHERYIECVYNFHSNIFQPLRNLFSAKYCACWIFITFLAPFDSNSSISSTLSHHTANCLRKANKLKTVQTRAKLPAPCNKSCMKAFQILSSTTTATTLLCACFHGGHKWRWIHASAAINLPFEIVEPQENMLHRPYGIVHVEHRITLDSQWKDSFVACKNNW